MDAPEGANSVEWPIEMSRASEAAARAFWPLGNTRLEKRLGLIAAPTLVLWGDRDSLLPPSYAQKFAQGKGELTARHGSKPSPRPAISPTSISPTRSLGPSSPISVDNYVIG